MTKKMKILIGYDGSDCAESALDDLVSAGLPEQAEVIAITVAETWRPSIWSAVYQTEYSSPYERLEKMKQKVFEHASHQLEQALKLTNRAKERIKSYFPDWQIKINTPAGSPEWELIKLSDEWQPDLIVTGAHSPETGSNLWNGNVTEKIITEARCSVRIAGRKSSMKIGPVKILIGVDGSMAANLAVAEVAQRNWLAGSEVKLITAVGIDQMSKVSNGTVRLIKENMELAYEIQLPLQQKLTESGLIVSSIIKEDDPKHLLINEAEQWQADNIFIGSPGLSTLDHLLLGSVSTAVVAHANCSVEVVRLKPSVALCDFTDISSLCC